MCCAAISSTWSRTREVTAGNHTCSACALCEVSLCACLPCEPFSPFRQTAAWWEKVTPGAGRLFPLTALGERWGGRLCFFFSIKHPVLWLFSTIEITICRCFLGNQADFSVSLSYLARFFVFLRLELEDAVLSTEKFHFIYGAPPDLTCGGANPQV